MLSFIKIVSMLMTLFLASTSNWSSSSARVFETQKKSCGGAAASICGGINISPPFRIQHHGGGGRLNCPYDSVKKVVECQNKRAFLLTEQGKFLIRNITYDGLDGVYLTGGIRLSDLALESDNCSLPRQALVPQDFIHNIPIPSALRTYYSTFYLTLKNAGLIGDDDDNHFAFDIHNHVLSYMYVLNCRVKLNSSANFIDALRPGCRRSTSFSYYFADQSSQRSAFDEWCEIEASVPIGVSKISGLSTAQVYRILSRGLDLDWSSYNYYDTNSGYNNDQPPLGPPHKNHESFSVRVREWLLGQLKASPSFLHDHLMGPILARYSIGMLGLFALIICKFRSKYLSVDDTIEEFLGKQDNLMSIRYSYSQIKKITEGFKEELGKGGFGTVFKGELQSGRLVAVKLLRENPYSNSQDFINEVASMGSIHHVNVMRLIGFCVEGCKQALIYDFMPNGSLDKVIFSGEKSTLSLSWQKIFDIAIGVARGMEYLHRGCDIQILHFDIKPHNILLDENFKPKVSDFGLAKLSSVDDTSITMTAARGTRGYIAPELLYRSIGGISYKADVYSFGMLLLEMAGRRRNLNTLVKRSSQIYFPSWIYRRFEKGDYDDIGEVGDATEEEKMMIRKMALVGFWCTQTKPCDRPSMTKVLEMLAGGIELPLAPKPFAVSLHVLEEENTDNMEEEEEENTNKGKEEESPSTSSLQIECC